MSHLLPRRAKAADPYSRLRRPFSLPILASLIMSLFTIYSPPIPSSASELTLQRPKATFYLDVELGCYSTSILDTGSSQFEDYLVVTCAF